MKKAWVWFWWIVIAVPLLAGAIWAIDDNAKLFFLTLMNGLTLAALYFLVASGFTLVFGLGSLLQLKQLKRCWRLRQNAASKQASIAHRVFIPPTPSRTCVTKPTPAMPRTNPKDFRAVTRSLSNSQPNSAPKIGEVALMIAE